MENESPTQFCRNCNAPLPEGAQYCPNCSQRNHDGRFTFWEFMTEALGNLFNLDNRIFGTLKAMVIPGKLTTAYFEGKHIRFYHPLRLFMLTGLALISIITVRYRQGASYAKMEKTVVEMERNNTENQLKIHLDSIRHNLDKELQNPVAIAAVDTFCARAEVLSIDSIGRDSASFNIALFGDKTKGITVSNRDLFELPVDSILNKYQAKGFWNRLLISRSIRMMKGVNEFLLSMFSNIIWMMLVMMPMLALCLKLLYYKKPYLFYEHLIFSMHVHSALFLLFFLLLAFYQTPPEWMQVSAMLLSIIYPFIALKRVYKEGIFKTTVKYIIISMAYSVLIIFSFVFMAIISFALF